MHDSATFMLFYVLLQAPASSPITTATEDQVDISPALMQANTSTKLVLEVIGLMCDGQHRSMQDYLRVQPDNYKASNGI